MDKTHPEDPKHFESKFREMEKAEAKLRNLEHQTESSKINDSFFSDKAERPIHIRTWESGNHAYVRAYDTNKVTVPDRIDTGQAGYANATLERSLDGQTRVRINDIQTQSEYRRAGTAMQMQERVFAYARKHDAHEVYGTIDGAEAHEYWINQQDKGWNIQYGNGKGIYGEVHYKLK